MYDGKQDDCVTQPLFGEARRKDKIINIVVATVTASIVSVTVVMSFINSVFFAQRKCHLVGGDPNDHICLYPMDIVFALVILLLLIPQVFVAMWYRRGELEPKFRRMIYYNAVVTILLCITANLYFFQVGLRDTSSGHCNSTV